MKKKIFDAIAMVICGISTLFGIANNNMMFVILGLGNANILLLSMTYIEVKKIGGK